MQRFTDSIARSLETCNWHAALYLSLTLPDICAGLESDNGKTNSTRYIAWFDRFIASRYRAIVGGRDHVFLSGNDCYALRCAALHEGAATITGQRLRQVLSHFNFTAISGVHCNQFNLVLQLDVRAFCNDVCAGVEAWARTFPIEHPDKLHRLGELITVQE